MGVTYEEESEGYAECKAACERGPVRDAGVRGPAEPEEPDGKYRTAVDGHGETGLWRRVVRRMLLDKLDVLCVEVEHADEAANNTADEERDERQSALAGVKPMALDEDDGVRLEEQVQAPVHEGHVHRDEEEHGLEDEDLHGLHDDAGDALAHGHGLRLDGRVPPRVARLLAQPAGLVAQDDGRIGLREREHDKREARAGENG